jgi:hypothetical protein
MRKLATAAALPGARSALTIPHSALENLRQLVNTIPDAASQSLLPVGQHEFTQCSNALAKFAGRTEASQPLPFPSTLLPPPL